MLYEGEVDMVQEEVLAQAILEQVGGKRNIRQVTYCMTRVRLTLNDPTKVTISDLRCVEGVIEVVEDETLQIVVGPGRAARVAAYLSETEKGAPKRPDSPTEGGSGGGTLSTTRSPFRLMLRQVGNIFIPLIPGLIASGLINGGTNFAINMGVDRSESWMQILLVFGSTIFAYLAVLVGWNTAKEFEGTPVLGAIAGGILFNPLLSDIVLYGEPLVVGRGGLFGVMFAAWLMTVVERRLRRVIPDTVDLLFTPLLTVLLVGFISLYAIMPVAGVLSDGVTHSIEVMLEVGGPVAGAVLAGLFLPLVMVGLHHGLTPIHLELIHTVGNTALLPILAMAGAGQVGAAMAIFVKTRNDRLRNIIKGAIPVGFLGIGEPLLYGVTLPLGRPFLTACLGAAVGGAFQAMVKTAAVGIGVSGLTLTPLIDDGRYMVYLTGLFISYGAGFVFTYLFGFKEGMAEGI